MKQSELCHPYLNDDGQLVSGAAAFSHHVFTEMGGIQQYNDAVGAEYLKDFIKEHSDAINKNIVKKAQKKRFKVIS